MKACQAVLVQLFVNLKNLMFPEPQYLGRMSLKCQAHLAVLPGDGDHSGKYFTFPSPPWGGKWGPKEKNYKRDQDKIGRGKQKGNKGGKGKGENGKNGKKMKKVENKKKWGKKGNKGEKRGKRGKKGGEKGERRGKRVKNGKKWWKARDNMLLG